MELRRGLCLAILSVLVGGTLLIGQPSKAHAATPVTWYVNKTSGNDANSCRTSAAPCRTIPGATNKAASGDTIVISANTYPGGISVSKSLRLQGAGAGKTVLQGGAPVLSVHGAINVTISGMTISGGSSFTGGGIDNYGDARLTVTNSTISNNTATGISGGGGINNFRGTLTLTNSTVTNNKAPGGPGGNISNSSVLIVTNSTISGGASDEGAGIFNWNGSTATLTNSTVSGNTSPQLGGALFNGGTLTVANSTISGNNSLSGAVYNVASLTLLGSTISSNKASSPSYGGSGILNYGKAKLSNTLLANNTAPDCSGTLTDGAGGHNVIGVGDRCGLGNGANGDQVGSSASPINPRLGPLQKNGGPTQTMALLPSSPAIGTGDPAICLAIGNLDQRGYPRHADARHACDIGAVDAGGHTWFVDLSAPKPSTMCAANSASAPFHAVQEALACAAPGDIVSIAGSSTSAYTGPLTLGQTVTLLGTGSSPPIVTAPSGTPVVTVTSTGNVALAHLVVRGGSNPGGNGGGIANSGTLTLSDSVVSKSAGGTHGGGVYNSGTLTLIHCTIDSNAARYGGGVYSGYSSTLTVIDSAISDNAARSQYPSSGGGIYSDYGSSLTITGSTISGDTANGQYPNIDTGGGIFDEGGAMTVANSTVSSDSATGPGGGILSLDATLTMTASTVSGNTSQGVGGGISSFGSLVLTGDAIRGNTALSGAGIHNDGGPLTMSRSIISGNTATLSGGGIENLGTLTVISSAITDNSANGDSIYLGNGGGIANSGTLSVTNSTISNNTAHTSVGGGISEDAHTPGTLTMTSTTISNNAAEEGGGVAVLNVVGRIMLANILLAGNNGPTGPDCFGTLAGATRGHNLIGIGDGCGLTNGQNGDQVGSLAHPLKPLLGLLQNNGGPTQTMALLRGSPAIDKGDNATCMTMGSVGVNNQDQRGYRRVTPTDKTCDIGAYEYGAH